MLKNILACFPPVKNCIYFSNIFFLVLVIVNLGISTTDLSRNVKDVIRHAKPAQVVLSLNACRVYPAEFWTGKTVCVSVHSGQNNKV